jgi:transposase
VEVLYPRCAAIDVHKATAVATVASPDAAGRSHRQTRTFSTMTADLARMADWFAEQGVTHVALESTGVDWKPIFNLLEERFVVVLANPRHIKAVPGRKPDVRDSEWLRDLLQHGLIQPSFIPPAPIRALRALTRYRTTLIEERTREVNRIQKVLEDCNIKLAAVATDPVGVSGRAMLAASIAGEDDPVALAALAKGRLRAKRAALEQARAGRVPAHHRLLLGELVDHIDALDRAIARLNAAIEEQTRPFAAARALRCSIVGVKQRTAEVVVAEIGVEMAAFPSAAHLCSWAAICPGNDERGGRRRSGRTRHGTRWLRRALLPAAWAATHVKEGYLAAQFRRIAKRRGAQRAAVAVAHSLLTIVYHRLRTGAVYEERGAAYFDRRDPDKQARYYQRRLEELGDAVQMEPQPAA